MVSIKDKYKDHNGSHSSICLFSMGNKFLKLERGKTQVQGEYAED